MEPPRYLVDVRSILEDLGAVVSLDGTVDPPALEIGTERYAPLEPAALDVTITNTGGGIVAGGTVTVTVQATCSRCLKEFPLTLRADVEGFFIPHGSEREMPEEQEFGFVEDGSVDLMDALLSALALEVPLAPVHAEDCAGICPTCGADLSEGPCECAPTDSESPFAVLKDLLPGDGGE